MEKKEHRSSKCQRTEPEGLDLALRDEGVQKAFRDAGCWNFCVKLKGGHKQVTKEFALNFTGLSSKVSMLEIQVSPEIIARVTEIPRGGQEWFKNFKFDMSPCKEFLKEAYVNEDLTKAVPRNYVKEHYALLLTCIQKYLTCEGRYNKVYSYHFKLLLHFTGKASIDIPFYLFRSLTKMCDKIQLKKDDECETSMFHHGLIKLLVLDSLDKIGRDWDSFIFMAGFQNKTGLTPLPTKEKKPVKEKEVLSKEPTIAQLRKEAKDKKKVKSPPEKPVKPLVIKELIQSSSNEKMKHKKDILRPSGTAGVSRVRTRSQLSKEKGKSVTAEDSPMSKASLNDLLEAIEFEQEEPVHIEPMHIDLTQSSPESSRKTSVSKRLRFEEPDEGFILKPRRPVTRRQAREAEEEKKRKEAVKQPGTELIEALHKIEDAVTNKSKGKKVVITIGGNVVAIKNQAGVVDDKATDDDKVTLLDDEVAKLKSVARERAIRYSNYRKAVLRGSKNLIGQGDSISDVYTWTVPGLKQAKNVNKLNTFLRAENQKLKKEVARLKAQLSQLAP